MALTQDASANKALANKLARQAIGWAIDYEGIRRNLLGDAALLPANFLPIGVRGSTAAIAKQIGYHQDLDRARDLLKQAGMADGFSFDINYGNAAIAGVSYGLLAQKIQSDLARVGIKANLAPLDQVTMRTQYTTGKTSAALTFWNPPAVENELWAAASVERVAKRVHWTPPPDLVKLVHQAAAESDPEKQSDLWVAYQKAIVDQANLITLFQPIYQIAVRDSIKLFPLTAAGWQVDLYAVKA
jgi:peptide/nickel transport system substrate-binding protein